MLGFHLSIRLELKFGTYLNSKLNGKENRKKEKKREKGKLTVGRSCLASLITMPAQPARPHASAPTDWWVLRALKPSAAPLTFSPGEWAWLARHFFPLANDRIELRFPHRNRRDRLCWPQQILHQTTRASFGLGLRFLRSCSSGYKSGAAPPQTMVRREEIKRGQGKKIAATMCIGRGCCSASPKSIADCPRTTPPTAPWSSTTCSAPSLLSWRIHHRSHAWTRLGPLDHADELTCRSGHGPCSALTADSFFPALVQNRIPSGAVHPLTGARSRWCVWLCRLRQVSGEDARRPLVCALADKIRSRG
jgi:hypothetical protein